MDYPFTKIIEIRSKVLPYLSEVISLISLQAFRYALMVGAGLYVLLVTYSFFQTQSLRKQLEQKLASYITPIEQLTQDISQTASEHVKTLSSAVDMTSLPPAPIEGFYKTNEKGQRVPIMAPDGRSPFDVYKRPFRQEDDRPIIALGVRGIGLSQENTRLAINTLPAPVSLIIDPFGEMLNTWQATAREKGHELWLEVPIENQNTQDMDLGSRILLERSSLQYNIDRLQENLVQADGYAGIAAYTDDFFVKPNAMTKGLFKNIYAAHGLGFLELNTQAGSLLEELSLLHQGDYIQTHIIIDENPKNTETTFNALKSRARKQGIAVGIIHATPHGLNKLKKWIATLQEDYFSIAPLSAAAEVVPHD